MVVFLDLDGVLVDLVGHMYNHFGWDIGPEHDLAQYSFMETYERQTGEAITYEQFWAKMDSYEFWANAPVYPHAADLVRSIENIPDVDHVAFLSCPLMLPPYHSLKGKFAWVAQHFPKYLPNTFLGQSKFLLSVACDAFLVDDDDNNVYLFNEVGGKGKAFLWPQMWNRAKHNARLTAQQKIQMCVDAITTAIEKKQLADF